MAEKEKVTIMVLKVDLQCHKCYKKVKKVLCKFPQIRDQIYDEKQNQVVIKVVCCSPEKIRDRICCKGRGVIKSIEIKEPEKPKPPPPEKPKPPPPPPENPNHHRRRQRNPNHHRRRQSNPNHRRRRQRNQTTTAARATQTTTAASVCSCMPPTALPSEHVLYGLLPWASWWAMPDWVRRSRPLHPV
ncbi:myelin-associated oligodendrocyte basic protein-like [Prunus yedoensis var. nudiflora]|uniref:Myelin-associated oligodendrocyte basic protein-like n=1 Tax=Prunus yedoensis var. nudiflora TaxID=2094558 RepID=A0A314XQ67_PRUYE|nr:myelin-associated oligodendrocyte basic protein-like [Prunus yedoensis var. nudiflora]